MYCFAGAKSAEALQTPNDCAICALKPRLHLLHGTAYVKHLHQGGFIRLRPRLARIGQWCRPLRPVRHIPQHAMQRADDLRPVADAVGRQALARQRVDAVGQFRQQRFCLPQFHRHALTPPPFVVRGQLPIALTLRHPSALIAIILRCSKFQIALTQPDDNVINDYQK